MKKKIAGKVGALLMAATMAFTGTTAAFAAEPADAHDDDVYEASVEQDQDEELSQASDRPLRSITSIYLTYPRPI